MALIMASTQLSAQCDCDKLEVFENSGYVSFSVQSMWIVNHSNGTATTTTSLCVYSASFSYTKKTFVCGSQIYCELSNWTPVLGSETKICDGNLVTPAPGEIQQELANAYSYDLENYFRNNMGCTPMLGGAMTVNGKCMAQVAVMWPPNANCPGQVVGENASGPIIGTTYPPSTMFVDCETAGCCTVDGLGNKDGSGVSCGNIDATSVRWVSPCGTFFGAVTNVLQACRPTCGDEGAAFLKMAGGSSIAKGKLEPVYFTKSISADKNVDPIYVFSLKNNGNTLHISETKNVKQVNIFDLSGKKTIEVKNLSSADIDISQISGKVLLIQVITTDNKIISGNKIQR
jgi:hypothetical protein